MVGLTYIIRTGNQIQTDVRAHGAGNLRQGLKIEELIERARNQGLRIEELIERVRDEMHRAGDI